MDGKELGRRINVMRQRMMARRRVGLVAEELQRTWDDRPYPTDPADKVVIVESFVEDCLGTIEQLYEVAFSEDDDTMVHIVVGIEEAMLMLKTVLTGREAVVPIIMPMGTTEAEATANSDQTRAAIDDIVRDLGGTAAVTTLSPEDVARLIGEDD